MDIMQIVYIISSVLVIVGALNWLSIGTMNYNFVEVLAGPMYTTHIYNIVGLAALVLISKKLMKYTSKGGSIQTAISV